MPGGYTIGEDLFPFYAKLEVFRYIDALTHLSLRETVLDGLVQCQQKYQLQIHAWLVMSGSVKLIASVTNIEWNVGAAIDAFMNYTDRKLINNIGNLKNETKKKWMLQMFEGNRRSQRMLFWHSLYLLDAIPSNEVFMMRLYDIHEDPVRNGLVWDAQHYMYSSAIDYIEGETGLLPIVKPKDFGN